MKLTVNGFVLQLSLRRFHSGFLPGSQQYWFPGRLLLKGTGRKVPSVSGLALGAQRTPTLSQDEHQIMLPHQMHCSNAFILELFQHCKGQICFSAFSTMLCKCSPKPQESCKWVTNWLHWLFTFGLYPNKEDNYYNRISQTTSEDKTTLLKRPPCSCRDEKMHGFHFSILQV